ncbi:MAG TPA: hypothetical protein VK982_12175, partial [Bacteroidales bacterium]|nr:hypothetical protein [Bacteroidales bacterium]
IIVPYINTNYKHIKRIGQLEIREVSISFGINNILLRVEYNLTDRFVYGEEKLKFDTISTGKLLSALFNKHNASESEKLKNYCTLVEKEKQKNTDFIKEIKGSLIDYYYNERNYTSKKNDSLHDSCLRRNPSVRFFSLFPDNISMLASFDEDNKLTGRALLWTGINVETGKKERVMDRIFYDSPDTQLDFVTYAKFNNLKTAYRGDERIGLEHTTDVKIILPKKNLVNILDYVNKIDTSIYLDSYSSIKIENESLVLYNTNRGIGHINIVKHLKETFISKDKDKDNKINYIDNKLFDIFKNNYKIAFIFNDIPEYFTISDSNFNKRNYALKFVKTLVKHKLLTKNTTFISDKLDIEYKNKNTLDFTILTTEVLHEKYFTGIREGYRFNFGENLLSELNNYTNDIIQRDLHSKEILRIWEFTNICKTIYNIKKSYYNGYTKLTKLFNKYIEVNYKPHKFNHIKSLKNLQNRKSITINKTELEKNLILFRDNCLINGIDTFEGSYPFLNKVFSSFHWVIGMIDNIKEYIYFNREIEVKGIKITYIKRVKNGYIEILVTPVSN